MSERQLSQTIAFVADTDRAPQRTSNTLRWADTDLNGHVTHPVFVEFFQNGRAQFLADRAWRLSPGLRWVTRHLTIDYLGEVSLVEFVEAERKEERAPRAPILCSFLPLTAGELATAPVSGNDRSAGRVDE